jgi:ADP-ribose pyrophosphatase YjhB (NUDIX family)
VNYCSECAGPVRLTVPPGDTLPRHVCDACERVFYENPKVVVGTLPVWEDRILLCKRAIEPRLGYWTLPSGFMENGETLEEGAIRETIEESGADVELIRPFAGFSITQVNQVYVLFLARMRHPGVAPGPETETARLVTEAEIPWAEIAFRAVAFCLERFVHARDDATFHLGAAERGPERP